MYTWCIFDGYDKHLQGIWRVKISTLLWLPFACLKCDYDVIKDNNVAPANGSGLMGDQVKGGRLGQHHTLPTFLSWLGHIVQWYVQLGCPCAISSTFHILLNIRHHNNKIYILKMWLLYIYMNQVIAYVIWFWPKIIWMGKEATYSWRQHNCTYWCKVCGCYLVPLLNQTPICDWYDVR